MMHYGGIAGTIENPAALCGQGVIEVGLLGAKKRRKARMEAKQKEEGTSEGVGFVRAMPAALWRSTKARVRRATALAEAFNDTYGDVELYAVSRLYSSRRQRRSVETPWGGGRWSEGSGGAVVGVQIKTSRRSLQEKIALLTALAEQYDVSVLMGGDEDEPNFTVI